MNIWLVDAQVTPELSLRPNEGSWNLRYGVLYIDQPIGTGFSTAGATQRKLNMHDGVLRCAVHI